jgi:ribosomal-protein-alanine N-acetyltransferase
MTGIRPWRLADLAALAALHAGCFASAWQEEFLGRLLAQPGAFCLLAIQHDMPEGFVIARVVAGEAEILSLGVRQAARRQGLGVQLIRTTADHAAVMGACDIFLEVAVDNDAARSLYQRLGFHEVGHRRNYYDDANGSQQDALILKRRVPFEAVGMRPELD